jgi:hypothetical protein
MKPSQVSSILRRIAAKIDASKRPDPKLVSRDLKRVIIGMESPALSEESMRIIEITIRNWKKAPPTTDDKVEIPGGYYMYYDPDAGGVSGIPNADDPVSLVRESDDEVIYSSDLNGFHTEDVYDSMQDDIENDPANDFTDEELMRQGQPLPRK